MAQAQKKEKTESSAFLKALKDTEEIELTVVDRTGRKTTRLVWFVHEGKTLYLLPVKGSQTKWYKTVLENPEITLSAEGQRITKKDTPISDRAKVKEVIDKFRAKYGEANVKQYYTIFDAAVTVPLAQSVR